MTAFFQKIISILTLPFVIIGGLLSPAPIDEKPVEREVAIVQKEIEARKQADLARIQKEINAVKEQIEILKKLKAESGRLGASLEIPTPVALFETTLASSISTSATSMTLTSATDKDGNTLASSTYGFILDEGTASEEMVLADCTSTACTNVIRGISVLTGTSSVSALKKAHRRGASVKITDGPILLVLKRIVNGEGLLPNTLKYKTGTQCSNTTDICSKSYIDNSVNQGAATSTQTNGGIVELATATEAASSTDLGGNQPLVLQAKNATSSPSGYASSTYVVVSEPDGTLSPFFLSGSKNITWRGGQTFASTTGAFEIQSGTTTLTHTAAKLGIGTTSPIAELSVATNTYIGGGLGIGTKATTTSGSLEVSGFVGIGGTTTTNGLAITGGICKGCVVATTSVAIVALSTGAGTLTTATAECPGNQRVSGGGYRMFASNQTDELQSREYIVWANGPGTASAPTSIPTGTSWYVGAKTSAAGGEAGFLWAVAICVNP